MLLDKTFSDLQFIFRDKKVFAHSFIVWIRAEGLLDPKNKANLEKKKKKRETGVTTIESGSKDRVFAPRVIELLFEYIYGGAVKFSALSQHDILHLNVAAKQYKLDRLAYMCELYLRETIALDNVHTLLKLSHDLKENSVKNTCLAFAVKHYQAFITNKTGIAEIGIDLFQEVVTRQAAPNNEKDDLPPAPASDYLKHWQHLHDEMLFADALAKVGNDKVRFHRAVLAAYSEPLSNHLKNNTGDEVPFNGISGEAFKSLLRFVYYGDTKLAATPATELIHFCQQFALPELSKVCEDKIRDSIDTNTVLDILAVTYLPYMERRPDIQDLRRKSLTYLLEHLTAVDLTPLRKLPPVIALDVLFACQAHEAKMPVPDMSHSQAHPTAPTSPTPHNAPTHSPRTVPAAINTDLRAPSSPALSPKASPRKDDKQDKKDKKKEKQEKKEKEKQDKKDKKKKEP